MSWSYLGWAAAVTVFGGAVGATELIARYRDAPFTVLKTNSAWWYILVNAAASLLAYILIVEFDFRFGATTNVELVQALVAGFGSMVFFRSSLFTMKVGETDVAVGPGILFQILLFATDRECDRQRAEPRSRLVNEIMRGVSFEQAREALPNFCFELMQNIPGNERQQFRQVVDALAASSMRDNVKVLNLGLMLMNVVGSEVLEAAVNALGEKIQGPAKLELQVFLALQRVDFARAYPLLLDLCFVMSRYYDDPGQAERARQDVEREMKHLVNSDAIDNGTKMTFLGLALQQRVGDAVLMAALAYLAAPTPLAPGAGAGTAPAEAGDAAPPLAPVDNGAAPAEPDPADQPPAA